MGVHTTLNSKTIGPGRPAGYDALEALVSAGLANADDRGQLRPQLAEAVPTTDNGLWRVLPDGRMETSWKLKPNAQWHDGTPFTTDDVLFTAKIVQDREIPNFRDAAFDLIEVAEAADPASITLRWKRPFIGADQMFTDVRMVPFPKHLLEKPYLENKGTFLELPYWRDDFVGTGPYRLREWALGSHVILVANERYVLGRPRVDTVEVRFIPDPNALVANALAGEIQLTMGRGLSLEQAVQLRDQWRDGKPDISFDSWIALYPQMINPSPAVIGDVRFRRALVQAINRQEMVETIQHGLVPVAHTILNPTESEYPDLEPSVVRYEYDPRIAVQAIEALGFRRGPDGALRDAGAQRLGAEIRSTGADVHDKSMLAVADYWQRAGIATETLTIPQARANDREWRNSRTGFELQRQPNTPNDLDRYHSAQVPLPENNFTGTSKHRYMNPELDALLDAFFATIPRQERVRVLAQILHHISDQVIPLPLFYDANPSLIGNRLRNITARKGRDSTEAWNAEAWDVQ
jgi:peptide/nickel transport system substrate-binding protein